MNKNHMTAFAGKTVCLAVSLCLATVSLPGVPRAQATQTGEWTAPVAPANVDDGVVTCGAHKAATAYAEMLGLNGTVVTAAQLDPQSLEQAQESDRFGVFGTDANMAPNPYLVNTFYNYYAADNGLEASGDAAAKDTKSNSYDESAFNATIEDEYNTPADLALRPDIVFGIGGAPGSTVVQRNMNHDKTDSQNYATWGSGLSCPSQAYQYVLAIRSQTDSDEVAGTKSLDGNVYEKSDYYRSGDETYDPVGVSGQSTTVGGANSTVAAGYHARVEDAIAIARAAKRVMQQDAGKTTRYGDCLGIALDYERFVKATKWHVLSELAEAGASKKTVAVVVDVVEGESTAESKFRLVKLDTDAAVQSLGTMRVAEAVEDTVEDLAAQVAPTAAAGVMRAGTAIDAEQLMEADVVVCLPQFSSTMEATTAQVESVLTAAGYSNEDANWPRVFDSVSPDGTFETNTAFVNSVEAGMLVGLLQGFVYPEYVDPVEATIFYASEFFHLKDAAVASFVRSELAGVTLPEGAQLDDARFTAEAIAQAKANVRDMFASGEAYYYARDAAGTYATKAALDEQRPNIASSSQLDRADGYGVAAVAVNGPQGSTVSVVDSYGLAVSQDEHGAYLLDNASYTATISLDGYVDYTATVSASTGSLSVQAEDMEPMRQVAISVPDGASLVVYDSKNKLIEASADGTYPIGAAHDASVEVTLEGYVTYTAQIPHSVEAFAVALGDMTRTSSATKVVVPAGSVCTVLDASGTEVESDDGTYLLVDDDVYILKVRLAGFEPYTTELVGGQKAKVTVYRKNMTALPSLADCTVVVSKTGTTYTGKALKPAITAKLGSTTLVQDTDYTVSYRNNVDAGTGVVTLAATDESALVSGETEVSFTISKAAQAVTAKNVSKTYKAAKKTKKLAKQKTIALKSVAKVKAKTAVTFKKANKAGGSKIKVASSGKVTVKKGLKKGTYTLTVKATAKASANIKAASKTFKVKVKVK